MRDRVGETDAVKDRKRDKKMNGDKRQFLNEEMTNDSPCVTDEWISNCLSEITIDRQDTTHR